MVSDSEKYTGLPILGPAIFKPISHIIIAI
jgi:hypothetical protein